MFALSVMALLCLMSVSRSAPLLCEDLLRPLEELDPARLEGRWAVVAGSMKDPIFVNSLKEKDSVAIDFYNSSYTQANPYKGLCRYDTRKVSKERNLLKLQILDITLTATFFNTSCPDCVVMTMNVTSPHYNTMNFYLMSRRREVGQEELEEFRAQVECMKMPPPLVMDPTKELCPEQTAGIPAEEQREGHEA